MINLVRIYLLLLNHHYNNVLPYKQSIKFNKNQSRLYQKKKLFPHSISNYEVSPNRFSSQPTTRYPSTPLLAHSRHKNIDKFDYHSLNFIHQFSHF